MDNSWVPEAPSPTASELEQLRRQNELILNSVGEGIYGLDLEGNVTFVNPAAAEMIGWQTSDLIGQSMHRVLHHSHPDGSHYPRQTCPIYAAFKDGVVHRVTDEVFWRKDGTSFPVEYISTPMQDEQGQIVGAVVTFRDVSERQWAERILQQTNEALELKVQERTAELLQANQQLQELSDLRSRFVAMVCHEFRNPLNNIALSVSSLERYDQQLSAIQKQEYLQAIIANTDRMTAMIDDILVLGRIEAQQLPFTPTTLELVGFCREVLQELQPTTPDHALHFTCRHTQIWVQMDEQVLRSILVNILQNAIRYSPNPKPIELKLARRKQQLTLQITDHGLGIPEADQPFLFEPFHRGRNVSNIPGTGLGLNIVKQFVALLHGTITFDSTLGMGTSFRIRLPLESPD
ncbi:PAS domain-containing sensor histidine kinase [Acaryochloris sp. CCMEE 5410]|uniref:PAS domain-containing sensor histidine kinase n=1 Tax=Acaryochloris sp. CCMEE 5410 TaxID=310037 RepID=UPI0002483F15|nr:PAS domain-containing sensor histidine kinase [Acaryochloris sp. CCMEE 5410]KAI9133018.1 PAS domain S-box protein [Acaryochloris sp. CCMEE 5410]